jgi:asparagine synthase (glutamine-hydrolysing)
MSAIAGFVGQDTGGDKPRRDVGSMLDRLTARGPDGVIAHAAKATDGRAVVLGARRLATAPSTPKQPRVAASADGKTALVCDAAVFNAAALRAELGAGVGDDPADILLALYKREGAAGFKRVDGQFALALWDGDKQALVLARDPLGVRAVYYHVAAGIVRFASEIKALLAVPDVPAAVDHVAVSHYLTFLTVPGPRTLFQGISKLAAGSTATFYRDGRVDVAPFWDLLWDPVAEQDSESFYVDKVRALHDAAVTGRMIEGPMAALVSGGNDSSANAVLMARKMANPSKDLHTFTVGLQEFEGDAKYNDLTYAKQVAEICKSQHHEYLMNTDEFLATIPVTIDAMDDLVSEPSAIFLHHALKLAKQQGMKVVVTGEANDELSCGHGEMIHIRDRYYRRWLKFSKIPGPIKKLAAAAAPVLAPKRADLLRRAAAGEEYFWNFEIGWPESEKGDILSPDALRETASFSAGAVVARDAERLRASAHGERDYLNHIIYRMMQDYYFGNLMLGKLDLLSSALSLEPRCPYTEPAYAHFVYNIPAKFKQQNGMVKYFFKKAIAGILPDSIIYRPKQGFRTPVVELFKGALADWGRDALLDGGLTRTGFLRRSTLADLLGEHRAGGRDNSNRLWTVLMLNLWHKRWIEAPRPTQA